MSDGSINILGWFGQPVSSVNIAVHFIRHTHASEDYGGLQAKHAGDREGALDPLTTYDHEKLNRTT